MKIVLILFTITITFFLGIFSGCSDMNDTDRRYIYLPSTITSRDASYNFLITKFVYDDKNRIVEITDKGNRIEEDGTQIEDSTFTNIIYNSDGNPEKIEVEKGIIENNEYIPTSLNIGIFTYQDEKIQLSYAPINTTQQNVSDYTIEINGKKQVTKFTDHTRQASILYEYDAQGNLIRTEDTSGKAYTYEYDKKRGMLRDVKMPQWFIETILFETRKNNAIYLNEKYNIKNNCLIIYQVGRDNEQEMLTTENKFQYIYGGFGYPVSIIDNDNFSSSIYYISGK